MPLVRGRAVQIFGADDFEVVRSGREGMLILTPRGGEANYKCCIFGQWGQTPHPKSKAVYDELVRNMSRAPKGIIFGVLDIREHSRVVESAAHTTTPLTTFLKVIIYGPSGAVVGVMPPALPRIPQHIFQFAVEACSAHAQPRPKVPKVRKRAPPEYAAPRTSRSRARPPPESSSEEEEDEPAPRKYYEPDFGNISSRDVKIRGRSKYVDPETFLMPEGIVPHNNPWKTPEED